MTGSKACTIRLLNTTYQIKCPEHEVENLEKAASILNKALIANKEKYQTIDDFNNLLLAALHLCHELNASKKEQAEQRQQMSDFINSLEKRISKVIED